MAEPQIVIPEPTAWKPREQAGAPPQIMLPEPTAWKPREIGQFLPAQMPDQSWEQMGWNAAAVAGALGAYSVLGYFIYHNFRIGARLSTVDMWLNGLEGRIPSGHEIVAHTYEPIAEIAAVLFLGDDDFVGDKDDWDLGLELTPTGRAYQAMHLVNSRLKDYGLSLDPRKPGDPPPQEQTPPLRILTHDDLADLRHKVGNYQALERIREGDFWDQLLQH